MPDGATAVLRTLTTGLIIGESPRSSSIVTDGRKTQTTHHERLDDGTWVPSMEVVLTRDN
jgi:hypothetical protein